MVASDIGLGELFEVVLGWQSLGRVQFELE